MLQKFDKSIILPPDGIFLIPFVHQETVLFYLLLKTNCETVKLPTLDVSLDPCN